MIVLAWLIRELKPDAIIHHDGPLPLNLPVPTLSVTYNAPRSHTRLRQKYKRFAHRRGGHSIAVCTEIRDAPARGTFRGSTLISAETLLPLSEIDARGFRRVRPGVEGVIKLCMNGVRKGGLPNWDALEVKRVAELLAADPDGVRLGAQLLGAARQALLAGAEAVVHGEWDRRAMATVEAWSLLRAVAEPEVPASRMWFLKAQPNVAR